MDTTTSFKVYYIYHKSIFTHFDSWALDNSKTTLEQIRGAYFWRYCASKYYEISNEDDTLWLGLLPSRLKSEMYLHSYTTRYATQPSYFFIWL